MTNMMMNGVVAINGGVGVMEIRQPLPQTVESVAQPVENLTVNAHISLRELKNTVAAVIEKKLPKYAQLMEMHPVIAARTVVGGATLTAYENGYAVYEEDGAHTVMAIDRCGDYRYDFNDGTYEVVPAEVFEDAEWSVRLVMEGERRMESNRSKTVAINEAASLDCDGSDWSDAVMVDFMDEENAEMLAEEELRKLYAAMGKNIEAQIWGEASDKTPVYAADVIVTYQVLPERSAWLYANVSDTKNLVGDELVASAIKSAMAELGPNEVTNRTKIEPLAQQKLAESLNQKYGEGAVFINKVVINDMDFEEAYNTAIQQKSIAQQNADKQKIENEAAIAKAEADKQVAITKAEAEAQKTSIAADAQAEANRKIAESLSDSLIEYQKIQKWDGRLPTVSGGNALVSIDPAE